ncbi:hypothetical protein [Natronomicrosphaera hydrolytica]|uniref:hypothetical protein n=1 Tax=Natronomicrosphaera hydrolytica TaxID=3242702 RepID=UPI003CC91B7E
MAAATLAKAARDFAGIGTGAVVVVSSAEVPIRRPRPHGLPAGRDWRGTGSDKSFRSESLAGLIVLIAVRTRNLLAPMAPKLSGAEMLGVGFGQVTRKLLNPLSSGENASSGTNMLKVDAMAAPALHAFPGPSPNRIGTWTAGSQLGGFGKGDVFAAGLDVFFAHIPLLRRVGGRYERCGVICVSYCTLLLATARYRLW